MILGDLLDGDTVVRHLAAGGLSDVAVARQRVQFGDVAEALCNAGVPREQAVLAFFVPGRIEVLGKHTDYAGGSSLVCAVERGFSVVVVPGRSPTLRLTDANWKVSTTLALDADLAPRPGHWSDYARTVAQRVARNFPGTLRGGYVTFASDLPRAAGLSSSSALVVAIFLALSALNDLPAHPAYRAHLATCEDRAHYLGCVENGQTFRGLAGAEGVGTFGGSEDHTAILCAAPDRLHWYAYAPTRFRHAVPVPEGTAFVMGASGVTASKTSSARASYNRTAHLAAAVADVWRTATGRDDAHLGAAVAAPQFSQRRMQQALRTVPHPDFSSDDLLDRFAQFFVENEEILPTAVEALAAGDVATFGACVERSQLGAELLLHNQIDETVVLVRQARRLGALAASAFGAGFGGSVWALVAEDAAASFREAWAHHYAKTFPEHHAHAAFFIERAGPAAFRLGAEQ